MTKIVGRMFHDLIAPVLQFPGVNMCQKPDATVEDLVHPVKLESLRLYSWFDAIVQFVENEWLLLWHSW